MRIEEKMDLIETMMCAGYVGQIMAVTGIGGRFHDAARLRQEVEAGRFYYAFSPEYKLACLEAAYRLIETSPALCHEWFGKAGAK